jgi:hypothetical protein
MPLQKKYSCTQANPEGAQNRREPFYAAGDGFNSLMPKRNISQHWTVEGKTPLDAWFLLPSGIIGTTGPADGLLRSKKKYRNFILKAEYCSQEGWEPKPDQHPWPNAGFFIHIKDGWPLSLECKGYFAQAGSLFGVRGGKITGAKRGRS